MKYFVALLISVNFLFAVGSLLAWAFLDWAPWAPLGLYNPRELVLMAYYFATILGTPAVVILAKQKAAT